MKRLLPLGSASKGFTIIELMIATVVFGVVLLFIATSVLQISRLYYKGITEAKVQADARSVIDLIAQGIQFNGGAVTETPTSVTAGNSYDFCIGSRHYSYTTGYQLAEAPTSAQTYHVLVENGASNCPGLAAQNVRNSTVTGRELLSPGMRLSKMTVEHEGGDLYRITVKVVHGEDDLLSNPNASGAQCQAVRAGTQFCAVSELTTVVTKRVE